MVLKVEFNSEELDEAQKLFIQHCKLEPVNKVIGTKIAKAQWTGKVSKWRENITTSPLGRHLGHFKALLRKCAESPDTKEGTDMESKKQGTINRGLHSGHQGRDTKTLSLIVELKYNISYSSRKSLINFDNDTALC
eukprot:7909229-Ditylum_brightwellii.AAC.1